MHTHTKYSSVCNTTFTTISSTFLVIKNGANQKDPPPTVYQVYTKSRLGRIPRFEEPRHEKKMNQSKVPPSRIYQVTSTAYNARQAYLRASTANETAARFSTPGMGILQLMYSHTTSMLYLRTALMGITGASSATVPATNLRICSCCTIAWSCFTRSTCFFFVCELLCFMFCVL